MLKYETLVKCIEESRKASPSILDMRIGLDLSMLIKEFACIGFRLPRCSGKTTLANMLHKNSSSLLYTRYGKKDSFNIFTEESKFRGRSFYGMKLEYIILDEFSEVPPEIIYFILSSLLPAGVIHRDFKIVSLYT